MIFRSKKPRITIEQSLAARPVRIADATVEESKDGGARLVIPVRQRLNWLFRLPAGTTKTFELDKMGRLVWDACDGKTSVKQIIRKLARVFAISPREAQVSTQVFIQTLAKKGLIVIAVPQARKK